MFWKKKEKKRPVVLIGDDDSVMRTILRSIVEKLECKDVIEVGDGNEAVAELEKQRITLAIIDINMPEMDGLEVLKIISEKYEDCSVVMISGDAALDRINKASELGAIDFIVKPFKTEAVEKKLSKITKKLFK